MLPEPPDSPDQNASLEATLAQVKLQLQHERQKTAYLTKELDRTKQQVVETSAAIEAEEELITNVLQRKLNQLRQEKVDLELQLEVESEFVVNKLQKQLQKVVADKARLAQEVENEEEFLTNTFAKRLEKKEADLKAATTRTANVISNVETALSAMKQEHPDTDFQPLERALQIAKSEEAQAAAALVAPPALEIPSPIFSGHMTRSPLSIGEGSNHSRHSRANSRSLSLGGTDLLSNALGTPNSAPLP